MRISELAEATNESPRTIRFYESLGLIFDPPRTSNGYRDYDIEAIDQIRFIRGLQAAGLTLAEIKAVSDIAARDRPLDARDAALITSARACVERHLKALNSVRAHLAALTHHTTATSRSRMLPHKSIPRNQFHPGRPTR
jgi:DNA-binding transcriptional MerR regulator